MLHGWGHGSLATLQPGVMQGGWQASRNDSLLLDLLSQQAFWVRERRHTCCNMEKLGADQLRARL